MASCGTWDGRVVGAGRWRRGRERESSGTQSQWPCDACKERQGNNAAASAGRSRRTKPPTDPSHEPGRMHTDVHTILVTLLRSQKDSITLIEWTIIVYHTAIP